MTHVNVELAFQNDDVLCMMTECKKDVVILLSKDENDW